MIVFIKLLLAHLLGDFLLQPSSWVVDKENKKHKSRYLYFHVFLHFLLTWVLVGVISFGWFALILAIIHGSIDWMKLRFQKPSTKRKWFIIDQMLHLIVLLAIAFMWENNIVSINQFSEEISGRSVNNIPFIGNYFWVYLTAVIFLTKPTSIIIRNIISIWTPEKKSQKDDSLQNAGNYIGILERFFVFYFVVSGHLEAVGFLLAAKSIFRFGDLKEAKDRKLTEYVLIGTLISFGFAFIVAILVNLSALFL
ncbi:MAG: DUF3307 domain-containing protein [Flavobacterium sp.]|nr:MAG: DUF3307 domain-containing protein [Flavobacterium sp.]